MSTGVHELRIADIAERHRTTMHRHVFEHPDHEVGGVLVGRIDGRTGQPRVTGVIPALEAVGERASVTFTHEAWELILERQEEEFPNTQIVGWYHSHPGFGIFLSGADLFIHQNFFGDRHQFAYVVDPIERSEGIFGWRDGEIAMFERVVDFSTAHLAGIDLPEVAAPNAVGQAAAAAFDVGALDVGVPSAAGAPPASGGKLTIDLDDLDDAQSPSHGTAGLTVGASAVGTPAVAAPGVGGAPRGLRGPVDPRAEQARQAARRRRGVLAAAASVVVLAGVGVVVATGAGGGDGSTSNNVSVVDEGAEAQGDKNAATSAQKATAAQKAALIAFSKSIADSKAKWKADHAPKPKPGGGTKLPEGVTPKSGGAAPLSGGQSAAAPPVAPQAAGRGSGDGAAGSGVAPNRDNSRGFE